jgi:hypothetical protein
VADQHIKVLFGAERRREVQELHRQQVCPSNLVDDEEREADYYDLKQ